MFTAKNRIITILFLPLLIVLGCEYPKASEATITTSETNHQTETTHAEAALPQLLSLHNQIYYACRNHSNTHVFKEADLEKYKKKCKCKRFIKGSPEAIREKLILIDRSNLPEPKYEDEEFCNEPTTSLDDLK